MAEGNKIKKVAKTKKMSLPSKGKTRKMTPRLPDFNPPIMFRIVSDNTELSYVEKLPISYHRSEALYVYQYTKASENCGKMGLKINMPKKDVERMIRQARFETIQVIY